MTFRPKTALLLACLVTAPAASSVAQTLAPAEKTDLLQRMNGVYYSLANQNFKGMQCGLDADYASIFSSMPELKDHPEKLAEVKKQLAKIHSQIAVSATGHAKVTTSGADTDSTPALETMTTGFNQGFQGFFLAWSSFALATPFPYKAEDVDIKPTSDGYVVSKSAAEASVESHFSRDLVVQQTIIDSPPDAPDRGHDVSASDRWPGAKQHEGGHGHEAIRQAS
jgi:uncharacterized phage protein gp47/JayE